MHLTENEKAVLKGACESEYDGFDYFQFGDWSNGTWVWSAIEHSELSPKIARGAISSLVKKGLVCVDEGDRDTDPSIHGSKDCLKMCENLGYVVE